MSQTVQPLQERLNTALFGNPLPQVDDLPDLDALGITPAQLFDWVDTQLTSRVLDLHSRELQAAGESFYTIGSAGHEGNTAIAAAFRHNDMAFLHYRSGAFFIQRLKQVHGSTPIYDMLLSFAASKDDPISAGRHKVLGSKAAFVPPQTSTIGSHLPKAVGMAHSIGLAKRLNHDGEVPHDAAVLCSFGDASANHSTSQGAINTACWTAYQSMPLPLVFVCEDNGIGISTATPHGWIEQSFSRRPGLNYVSCDGRNLLSVYAAAKEAERIARKRRQPVFLHMKCVRLYGHAGSDAEMTYLSKDQIAHNEANDPLRTSLALLEAYGIATRAQMQDYLNALFTRVRAVGREAIYRDKLKDSREVMASIAPQRSEQPIPPPLSGEQRQQLFAHEKHNIGKPQTLNKLLNWALHDLFAQYPHAIMMGEDIGKKGGVYGVTSRLVNQFGPNRIMNTLLDEQSILGMAIGAAHNGFLPMPEIQFLAYVHNAEDQIRGEAATLSFFSSGQYTNPMVIRVAGLAYQRGFGGHFHNDNSFAVFRDLPGVVVACPSNGASAARMLREAVRLADEQKRVVIFLEPIALYNQKDLYEAGDNGWMFDYPDPHERIGLGEVSVHESNTKSASGKADLCIVSYGNGYYLSRQAQKELADNGVKSRVVDLNWLHPLPMESLLMAISDCPNILIVDECRETGSVSEELWTRLQEAGVQARLGRLCADDSFIPLAKAAYHVLPAKDGIVRAAQALIWGQDSPDADTIAGLRANSSKGGTLKPGAKIGSKGQAGEKS
ncbi:dehydrogenase E1 component subunit alpha/beta [Aliidiomarina haloalkalitolerans]|uniref:3-methyl-2-oxobutanoate dehydrogenase (2-methylpropanoyl-transferring) n=1 Tax=Aliidiomarina haloalkalitolerans TaxID=859059 RepID=A0A432VVZ5_9GAMM|nr:thiamine pyrophosphate-dependent enzyme [Aliidiomarina haloalkalitolerans]RUO20756.1 MFS transporter [Aliidiomarina haloalkalitolerans]